MSIDRLSELSQQVAAAVPDIRAPWYQWVGELLELLSDLLAVQRQQAANLQALRNDLDVIIYRALREYGAGADAKQTAIYEELAILKENAKIGASDRQQILAVVTAIAGQFGVTVSPPLASPPPHDN